MVHTVRCYGNLSERTWKMDEEPAPELKPGDNPWMLVATATFEDKADPFPYPLDLEQ